MSRTTPNISQLFDPLEDAIRTIFIPSLTSRSPPSDEVRALFSFPVQSGGLGISNPVEMADVEFSSSRKVCDPLIQWITDKSLVSTYYSEIAYKQILLKRDLANERKTRYSDAISALREALPEALCRSLDLASEKGSSVWLTCLPIEDYGFCLHKRAFSDALALRYGWIPSDVSVLVMHFPVPRVVFLLFDIMKFETLQLIF